MKPDLFIINGPLGAGKTTILRELIKTERFKNARIIENEFASVSVDTTQLHDHQAEVQTIAGLCICCSTGSELVDALRQLSSQPQPVIIEATGVANSLQLVEKLAASDILERYTFAHALFVLDAAEFTDATLTTYGDELRAADVVLLTKGDLISEDRLAGITAHLAESGIERVHTSRNGVFDTSIVGATSDILTFYAQHEAEFTAHDDDTNYTLITPPDGLSGAKLETIWRRLADDFGLRRMKGSFFENGTMWHVEATPSQILVTSEDADAEQLLVLIGTDARKVTAKVLSEYIEASNEL